MTIAAPPRQYRTALGYTDRRTKALYIADKYAPILIGSILDVGCDQAPLRKLVHQPFRYHGVDLFPGGADTIVDLDREPLPFPDQHFDTVLATDVLEHLERCHSVFDELCRVSRCHVIVSLPNPLHQLLRTLCDAPEGGGRLKYYGLPAEAPADRHRWFFGHEEAVDFLSQRGRRSGFGVEQIDAEESPLPVWKNQAGENILDQSNIRGGTIWCVLRRVDAAAAK
jgi:hypothetical protein